MKKCIIYIASLIPLLLTLTFSYLFATEKKPIQLKEKDKCPVCGMFVAKFPDFLAEIIFNDGSYAVFDGAKDMFKYYLNLRKYNPKKNRADIYAIYVTDYYTLKLIEGKKAYYVIGSDVYGPMGKELIPFKKLSDAEEFKQDHKGKSVLIFRQINSEIIKGID